LSHDKVVLNENISTAKLALVLRRFYLQITLAYST